MMKVSPKSLLLISIKKVGNIIIFMQTLSFPQSANTSPKLMAKLWQFDCSYLLLMWISSPARRLHR
jgi:hypothetical protein